MKTAIPQPLASAFCLGEKAGRDALEVNGNGRGERKRARSDAREGKSSIYYVLMKTRACFPILPSWPDIVETRWKYVIANQYFGVKINHSPYFFSPRYLMSHTGSFSSSATVLRKVGASQRWLKGKLLISVTVETYLALLLTIKVDLKLVV